MVDQEKLVIMVTHGPSEPELATIPFVLAAAAVASEVEVVMGFQADGCLLVRKGAADGVVAPGFTPISELLPVLLEAGSKLLVCSPCIKSRGLVPEDFVEGSEIVASARFVSEITSASNCVVY